MSFLHVRIRKVQLEDERVPWVPGKLLLFSVSIALLLASATLTSMRPISCQPDRLCHKQRAAARSVAQFSVLMAIAPQVGAARFTGECVQLQTHSLAQFRNWGTSTRAEGLTTVAWISSWSKQYRKELIWTSSTQSSQSTVRSCPQLVNDFPKAGDTFEATSSHVGDPSLGGEAVCKPHRPSLSSRSCHSGMTQESSDREFRPWNNRRDTLQSLARAVK